MIFGHFSGGFLAKAYDDNVKMVPALVATQIPDLAMIPLQIANAEQRTLVLYTHSLAAVSVLSAITFLVFYRRGAATIALLYALCVLSHFFEDLIFFPVLPLTAGIKITGGGLLLAPPSALLAEMTLLAICSLDYYRASKYRGMSQSHLKIIFPVIVALAFLGGVLFNFVYTPEFINSAAQAL